MKCSREPTCEAVICPLDETRNTSWFADEEVCRNRKLLTVPGWLIVQRKLSKLIGSRERGYFTKEMLACNPVLTDNIQGLNPRGLYSTEAGEIRKWIRKHTQRISTS